MSRGVELVELAWGVEVSSRCRGLVSRCRGQGSDAGTWIGITWPLTLAAITLAMKWSYSRGRPLGPGNPRKGGPSSPTWPPHAGRLRARERWGRGDGERARAGMRERQRQGGSAFQKKKQPRLVGTLSFSHPLFGVSVLFIYSNLNRPRLVSLSSPVPGCWD